jgi:hypothetical protein
MISSPHSSVRWPTSFDNQAPETTKGARVDAFIEVIELTAVERVEFTQRALVASEIGDFLCDVHFSSPSFDDLYVDQGRSD